MLNKSKDITLLSLFSAQKLLYPFHSDLSCFGEPDKQRSRLQRILSDDQTQICIAVHQEEVVGYATLLPPEPEERWSSLSYVRVMGALEVASIYRRRHIACAILQRLFHDAKDIEKQIVLAFAYYWHWDLNHSELGVYEYKRMLKRLLISAGMEEVYTDEPDVHAHSANFSMARIGRNLSTEHMQRFFYTLNPRIW